MLQTQERLAGSGFRMRDWYFVSPHPESHWQERQGFWGRLFIAHLLGSKELQEHHRSSGDIEVMRDILPAEKVLKRMLKREGFKKILIIDKPSLYIACGSK